MTGVLGLAGVLDLAGVVLVLIAGVGRAVTAVLDFAGVLGLAGVLVLAADLESAFREGDFLRPVVSTLDWAFALIFLGAAALAFTDLVFFLATMRAPPLRRPQNRSRGDATFKQYFTHTDRREIAGKYTRVVYFGKGQIRYRTDRPLLTPDASS